MNRKFVSVTVAVVLSVAAISLVARPVWAGAFLVTSAQFSSATAYTGAGANFGASFWNEMGNGGYTAGPSLENPTNTGLTGITVTTPGLPGGDGTAGGFGADPTFAFDLYNSLVYASGTYTIGNVPTGTYDLYLYSQNGYPTGGDSTTQFTIGAANQTVDGGAGNFYSSFVPGGNYTEFVGLSPVSGNITVSFTATGAGIHGILNGFQLVNENVPEPSGFIMAGIGLVGVGWVARRRRK